MRFFPLMLMVLVGFVGYSQDPHDEPDHPKGNNSNDQYLALPHYNEACELYAKGEVQRAKRALREAMNISFALTEAQLFMGMIMYEENKLDSACLFLNSGIDFAIEQDPHYYFYFFEVGLRMEMYAYVKHNMKQFKRLYGKQGEGKYEKDHPFIVDDWEKYQNAFDIIYNYEYWVPKSYVIDTLDLSKYAGFTNRGNDIVVYKENINGFLREKKNYKKRKKIKYDLASADEIHISKENNYLLAEKEGDIYFAKKEGKSWGDLKKIEGEINTENWDGDPYFYEEHSLIYFSSDRNGSKDIYVVKVDLETGKSEKPINIERINTPYDEIKPKFVNNHFYFSSNGLPGFGGFDLFYTPHWWMENGIVQPSDWFNMGKPYNSGKDELGIYFFDNDNHLIHQTDFRGGEWHVLMHYLHQDVPFDMDIKVTEFPVDLD